MRITGALNFSTNVVYLMIIIRSQQVILPALNVNSASLNASNTIIFDFTSGWLSPNASFANYISGFSNATLVERDAPRCFCA